MSEEKIIKRPKPDPMKDAMVHVSLTPDGHPSDCDCGSHYSAIVMAWDATEECWYNTGIVEWENNPLDAFKIAFKKYKQQEADK